MCIRDSIKHIENGKEVELKAPLLSDCTGDGTIGYLAGADYNMGRESRTEYGEELAPIQPDKKMCIRDRVYSLGQKYK